MITLVAKDVMFLSEHDEDCFFAWLDFVQSLNEVRGVGHELHIEIDEARTTDSDLRELIALFRRYLIDMRQLAQLVNQANEGWFRNDQHKYWHKAVFGE